MRSDAIDRAKMRELWDSGMPPKEIAAALDCHPSSVWRIANDEAWCPQTQEARDLFIARQHLDVAAKLARSGVSIDAIAERIGAQEHIARAAVYLATQAGMDTGLTLGA